MQTTQIIRELKNQLTDCERMEQKLRLLIAELERTEALGHGQQVPEFQEVYSLSMGPAFFKGKRPESILFPDGRQIATPTWKKFVAAMMDDCNRDPDRHRTLMAMRNWVQGRDRTLLGKSAEKMRSPIKIDDGLFLETHYDTESLLRITTERILSAVGYNYNNIQVTVRKKND